MRALVTMKKKAKKILYDEQNLDSVMEYANKKKFAVIHDKNGNHYLVTKLEVKLKTPVVKTPQN